MSHNISRDRDRSHHLNDDLAEHLIIHHSQDIIERIRDRLKDVTTVDHGNYTSHTGTYKGKNISLICTGMTAGNTALIVDQAIDIGVNYIFKLGTFGALQDRIEVGDVYIAEGAARSDGLTDAYAPLYYPAVPDLQLATQFIQQAEQSQLDVDTGIIHSVNIYSQYYEQPFNREKYSPQVYRDLGAVGVEMETAATYICSSVQDAKALAVLICNRDWQTQQRYMEGDDVEWGQTEKEEDQIEKAYNNVIQTVLDTIARVD